MNAFISLLQILLHPGGTIIKQPVRIFYLHFHLHYVLNSGKCKSHISIIMSLEIPTNRYPMEYNKFVLLLWDSLPV